jgi:hypothetical protein
MSKSLKQVVAGSAPQRRVNESEKTYRSGAVQASGLPVKLDRLQLYCDRNPTAALMRVPGFKSLRGHRIDRPANGRFQAYGHVHWFECRTSGMKFLIESEPREAWLPPYRVTLYADDRTGLLPSEIFSVLEVLPDFKMTLVELAFDFGLGTITRKFVRERALFGKSRPAPGVNGTDYYGTRRGSKRVQVYEKKI